MVVLYMVALDGPKFERTDLLLALLEFPGMCFSIHTQLLKFQFVYFWKFNREIRFKLLHKKENFLI